MSVLLMESPCGTSASSIKHYALEMFSWYRFQENAHLVVYGHIHRPFVDLPVANSGSVGQSHDGDPRASYLLIDDGIPAVQRVEYSVDTELRALQDSAIPHASWLRRILEDAAPNY